MTVSSFWLGHRYHREILGLWGTDIDLRNGHLTELWIGSVVEERLGNRFPFFTVSQAQPDANGPRDFLAASLDARRLVTRPDLLPIPVWDGQFCWPRKEIFRPTREQELCRVALPATDREHSLRDVEMHETRYQFHSFASGVHMTLLVFLNASAGTIQRADYDVEAFVPNGFRARGLEAEVRMAGGGQIAEMAHNFVTAKSPGDKQRTLVVGGGDSTLGSAASAVVGTDVMLGVLPLGTLNHFARDLGLSNGLDAAMDTIAAGHVEEIDVAGVAGTVPALAASYETVFPA